MLWLVNHCRMSSTESFENYVLRDLSAGVEGVPYIVGSFSNKVEKELLDSH